MSKRSKRRARPLRRSATTPRPRSVNPPTGLVIWVALLGWRLVDRVARDLNAFAGIRRTHLAAVAWVVALAGWATWSTARPHDAFWLATFAVTYIVRYVVTRIEHVEGPHQTGPNWLIVVWSAWFEVALAEFALFPNREMLIWLAPMFAVLVISDRDEDRGLPFLPTPDRESPRPPSPAPNPSQHRESE